MVSLHLIFPFYVNSKFLSFFIRASRLSYFFFVGFQGLEILEVFWGFCWLIQIFILFSTIDIIIYFTLVFLTQLLILSWRRFKKLSLNKILIIQARIKQTKNSKNIIKSNPMIANPPKPIPRKINYKLHYYNKSPYCLFLYYAQGHPVNIKDRFIIGHMKIFNQTQMFVRELYSTDHLNSALEWDNKYFYALLANFKNFQIKAKQDLEDRSLDFIVRGQIEQGIKQFLLKATIQADFGTNIQKQFWKQFENYNNNKNQQIRQQEQLIKQSSLLSDQKLDSIKKYCDQAQTEKKALFGKLSAILMEKVNKLKEYQDDYNIELLEDKFRKAREQQQSQPRVMSTYEENAQYGASLFQPSQQFR